MYRPKPAWEPVRAEFIRQIVQAPGATKRASRASEEPMAQASARSRRSSTWHWAIISVLGWLVLSPVAVWIGGQAEPWLTPPGVEAAIQVRSAVMHAGWAAIGVLTVLAGRALAFGMPARLRRSALVALVGGIAVALALDATLLAWGHGRFGAQGAEPDLLGPTRWLPALMVVVAVARFATHIAPSGRARLPLAALGSSAALAAVVMAANVPGLQDGIAADSNALAAAMAASGVYLVTVVAAAVRERRDLWRRRSRR